jgi:Family of unknown function (DUF5990)
MNTKPQNNEITIEVVCRNLPGISFHDAPGREPVHLGIQQGNEVIEAAPANRKQVVFRPAFRVVRQADGSPNFLGPFAKGTPQERFFYLSWGVVKQPGQFEMFRRAKIHLNHLTWEQVQSLISSGKPLKVVIDMTDRKGGPLCASVRRRPPGVEGAKQRDGDRADWQVA